MQMIPAVQLRLQPVRLLRIAHRPIEVDHRVEVSRRPDPRVHRLPVGLVRCVRMVVVRAHVGRDGPANRFDPVLVRLLHHLLVAGLDSFHQSRVRRWRLWPIPGQHAQIVHTLQHDDPPHPRLRQHVSIEARQSVRTRAVEQQAISANPLVQHPDVARRR